MTKMENKEDFCEKHHEVDLTESGRLADILQDNPATNYFHHNFIFRKSIQKTSIGHKSREDRRNH
jgi:hypothetical protein